MGWWGVHCARVFLGEGFGAHVCEEGGVHLGLAISGPPGVRVGLDVGKVDPGVAGACRGDALPLIADVSVTSRDHE